MLEEIVDAFFFKQALDEIEVGLTILQAVLALEIGMALEGAGLDVRVAALSEAIGDDGQRCLTFFIDHTAVAGVVEELEIGVDDDLVACVIHHEAGLGKVGDDAVRMAIVAGVA